MKKAVLYARVSTDAQENIGAIEGERRRLIDLYAANEITREKYIAENRARDRDLERLTGEKAALVARLRSPQQEDFVDASVRQFCGNANARLQACTDSDAKQEFLVAHVERVIYKRYKITIKGSVPVRSPSGETKLPFAIKGEINIVAVRSNSQRIDREKQLSALRGQVSYPVAAE